jgi:hypothetical protein
LLTLGKNDYRVFDNIQSINKCLSIEENFENTIDLQQSTINKFKRELNSAKDVIFRLRRNEEKLREK